MKAFSLRSMMVLLYLFFSISLILFFACISGAAFSYFLIREATVLDILHLCIKNWTVFFKISFIGFPAGFAIWFFKIY
jgi:hypothetical protein